MRFLAALFLVVAALTSPVLAQLDTANVHLDEWKSSNIAWFLYNLGVVAVQEGDYSRGEAFCEESVGLGRQLGMKYFLDQCLA
jgi:hypothetical protein